MAKRAWAVSTVLPAGAKHPAVEGVSRTIVSAGPSMVNCVLALCARPPSRSVGLPALSQPRSLSVLTMAAPAVPA